MKFFISCLHPSLPRQILSKHRLQETEVPGDLKCQQATPTPGKALQADNVAFRSSPPARGRLAERRARCCPNTPFRRPPGPNARLEGNGEL